MIEASWGADSKTPSVDWRMSGELENVPRGDGDVAEVTSLGGAVRTWAQLDPSHRASAVLTLVHPVQIDAAAMLTFSGEGIAVFAERLPHSADGR